MKTAIQIKTIGVLKEITQQWAVYTLQDATTWEFVHVGVIRLSQLFSFCDAHTNSRVDFKNFHIIEVFEVQDNIGMAHRAAIAKIRELNLKILPKPHSTTICCITTGEVFHSAIEVVRAHGVTQSQLSNHLNNKPGFKTVKGKLYKKVM